jgi:flagellar biosynthesis protein FlhB
MAEELGERTEQPTARRLTEARERGQVAKSQDLSAAVDLIGGAAILAIFGGFGLVILARIMRGVLEGQAPGDPLDLAGLKPTVLWATSQAAWIVIPMLLAMFIIAGIGQVIQVGVLFTGHPLKPKLERLNPFKGLKKLFNLRSLVKTAVNVIKLVLIVLIASLVVYRHLPAMAALPMLRVMPAMYKLALIALELAAWILVVLLAIGIVDYMYQRWQHTRDLRMTRQEVKDERRSMDGDPEVRARRLRMARDIALQRIQQAVPKADVIVTNPSHFSIAIKYDAATMRAPRVVAKGADYLAFRIRHVALAAGIPIVERPPLARGLYWGVDVGREISPEFYEAVAEVLAYVYRIGNSKSQMAIGREQLANSR